MYLGIDLGTSAVKTCLLSDAGAVLATSQEAYPLSHPFEGASEQDPALWWRATCAAVAALAPEQRAAVRAIGLSGQMHGAVLLGADEAPLRPAILWNDSRAEADCARLIEEAPEVGQITGVLPMAGFTAPKLMWLAREEPALHARITHVLLPKDYIGLCLHGNRVTDPSDAAGTCWLDQASVTWSEALSAASATDPAWLPPILPGAEVAGQLRPEAARALGLAPGLPVVAGAGDAAAGAVGIGAVSHGDGFISLGTSGQLFATQGAYRPLAESRIHAYAHTLPDHWFNMAAMLNGARPMAWLAELLGRPIADLLAGAEAAPPDRLLFLPYLSGERTPHGDAGLRAGFYGLGEGTRPENLMRAVVEAIAFSFADAARALAAARTEIDSLLAIGGGTRSDFLMQCLADVLDRPIGRSRGADIGPALGAARLARMGAEGLGAAEVATKPPVEHWFIPHPARRAQLAPKLAAYRALYPGLAEARRLLG